MTSTRRTKAERRAFYCASCVSHGDHPTEEHTDTADVETVDA